MTQPICTEWNDIMRRGATFYREIQLYSDKAKTQPFDLTGYTPVGKLMTIDGAAVADFACAIKGSPQDGVLAWSMPKATTSTVPVSRCIHNIDVTVGEDSYPALMGAIEVIAGRTE